MVVVAAVPSEGKLYIGDGNMGNDIAVTSQQWKQAVGELQLQVTPDIFEMYLQPLRLVEGPGCTVLAPNQFVKDWLDMRLGRAVTKTLRHIIGEPVELTVKVADAQQMALAAAIGKNEAGGVTLVQAGELRDAGYVRLWHDLRNFYGPRIGLDGVGLWAELRAQVHSSGVHPLSGFAWPGYRGLGEAYGVGRDAIPPILERLREAKLVEWQTGRDLIGQFDAAKRAGVPDSENTGVPLAVLRRIFKNPMASRVYTVHDPLELPQFCVQFSVTLSLDDDGKVVTDREGVRLSRRWQDWVSQIMQARQTIEIEPWGWVSMGLARSI